MKDVKTQDLWLMHGDCLERMKEIPSGSVDMVLHPTCMCDITGARQENGI